MRQGPLLHLTWSGLDAAVDLIAAQCRWRERSGVWSSSAEGQVLALALADRLSLTLLALPTPGMLQVDAVINRLRPTGLEDVEHWAWVDATPECTVNSAMKVTPGTFVMLPWQDARACCRRPFVTGFDD
jgi:hypothetical protein